jgi:GT2 family glycosyltransferase
MVARAPSSAKADITVVVVTWNGAHLLGPCLDSLLTQTRVHDVLIVDNASSDDTTTLLAERFPTARVLRLESNTGFAGGLAAALPLVDSPYLALLNNDAVARPNWLAALADELASDPNCAAVTSRILLAGSGRVNNAGGALTRLASGYDRGLGEPDGPRFNERVEVAALCGGAALLRTDPVRSVGGVPAEYFLYYEDTDLSWRLRRAGYSIRYCPEAIVDHLHSASSDQKSAGFAYYNQRNQLLTVVRNAPWTMVAICFVRFIAISVLDLVRSVARRSASVAYQQQPRRRFRVLADTIRALPAALRARRANAPLPVSRAEFARSWLGVESRPLDH